MDIFGSVEDKLLRLGLVFKKFSSCDFKKIET